MINVLHQNHSPQSRPRPWRLTGSMLVLLGALLTGCPQKEEQPTSLQTKEQLTDSERAVSVDQAEAFAAQVKSYFTDPDSGARLPLDKALFAANVGIGLPKTSRIEKNLAAMSNGAATSMSHSIQELLAEGGDYSLQMIDESNGRRRVRMRLLLPNSGVNYHNFLLVHHPSGIVADDIEVLASGELLSKTLNRMALELVADEEPDAPGGKSVARPLLAEHLKEIQQMSTLHNKQPVRVLEIYNALPQELQQEKIVMLYRVFATSLLDEKDYLAAMGEMRARFPNDPAVLLQSFDYFLLSQQYDASRAAIDELDKIVGGDPYLNVLRGAVAIAQGKKEQGVTLAKLAGEALPEILAVQWQVARTMLSAEDFVSTLEQLKLMNTRFDMNWEDLNILDNYEKFIESPQHEEWQNVLKQKK